MKEYQHTFLAKFIKRPNRFIAHCQLLYNNEEVVVHVKNTGRCQELLTSGVTVSLSYEPSPKRKTDYDLIAVKKGQRWINIDSQVPNQLVAEALAAGELVLPGILGGISEVRREVTFGDSKFDVQFNTSRNEKGFIEVKGMTLENKNIAAFPDAPSLRALKHVNELGTAHKSGYRTFVVFVIQMTGIKKATIDGSIQPLLKVAFERETASGLEVLAYQSQVTDSTIKLEGSVPFDLAQDFVNPNR